MANALAALKSLPCPAGDSCTEFQCLFSHPRDQSEAGNKAIHKPVNSQDSLRAPAASRARPYEDEKNIHEQDLQRKRIKLDVNDTATVPQPSSTPAGRSKTQVREQRKVLPGNTPATVQQGGSPHILKRNTPSFTETNKPAQGPGPKPQQPMAITSIAHAGSSSLVPGAQPKQPSKEPESLNPRLLKKAPTSHATRVALVKALHAEFRRLNDELKKTARGVEKKWLLSDQELIVKTLDAEQEIAIKKTAIYNTSIRNKILTYKRMSLAQWKEERSKLVPDTSSDDTEPHPATTPETIETGLTQWQEVGFLPRLVEDLTTFEAFGYISKIPSKEDIEAAEAGIRACGNTETCDRCTRRFQVFPGRRETDGALSTNGPCVYHPGKLYFPVRAPGDRTKGQRRFRCCQRSTDDDAGGCTVAQHHVFKTTDPKRLAAVLNFVNTPINPDVPKDRAASFDCEMGYTVYGLELVRLTVVAWPAGDVLLDILVQPVGEVLDLNTRFSGVRPEDMASAERFQVGSDHRPTVVPSQDPTQKAETRLKIAASPKAARDLLFTIISAETPLIGHGLENDLNAARIVHPTCIDTVLLWPHSRGLPMRNGLKYLMQTKLGRMIQEEPKEGSPEGHDSAEDARAAGDLVRLKIRDEWKDMRMKGWTTGAAGELLAPGDTAWTVVGGSRKKPA
ncbi:putative REX3-RNA member of the family of 3`-5` exonuclease [Rosellinia necatrix]|uniref:Putative REX3-RNA member of the family of 3`-5` exonuclease n=1 Tax=Rosellinia necatrix TaxID=77044 RepID=A0A1W2TD13_ROSNE|nr:putative REX3-RNA member of the family of 3`-5` exonuclease [Rosellinia necatrix]